MNNIQFLSQHAKTYLHIANCLEKINSDYEEIVLIFEKALNSAVEAKDDLLVVSAVTTF